MYTELHSDSADDGVSGGVLTPGSSGCWCFLHHPALPGGLLRGGFDWVVLDAQHGEFDDRALRDTGRTLLGTGLRFGVRVSGIDQAAIGSALDVGASTVLVPQVDSADDAHAVVRFAHYPPRGTRSWGPLAPLWGLPAAEPRSARPQIGVMIESAASLANVEAIVNVTGVDLIFVGPFDLSLSLGLPLDQVLGDLDGPLRTIADAGRSAGVALGAFAGTPQRARQLQAFGFDRLAVTTDAAVISAGSSSILADLAPVENDGAQPS